MSASSCFDHAALFSAALKKTWKILSSPSLPHWAGQSMQPDILSHSSLQLMSLTWFMQSLSPHYHPLPSRPHAYFSAPLSSFTFISSSSSHLPFAPCRFVSIESSLPSPAPSRSSLQSSLSNGDKGRPADYLSNGKKRKADEKEFMTDYVRTFS